MCSHHPHLNELATHRRLKYALLLNSLFVIVELGAGLLSGSLALLSDGVHNAIDSITLGTAWVASWLAMRPADRDNTYGYQRYPVLFALLNALILVVVVAGIAYNAFGRFLSPVPVDGTVVLVTGLIGIASNLGVVFILRDSRRALHVQGAYLHNLTDAASSALVVVSGAIIVLTGALWVDLVLSLLICAMLVKSLVPVFRKSVHILLEGTPEGIDLPKLRAAILSFPEVAGVHDLHCWTHGDGMAALTCHVVIRAEVPHEKDHDLVNRLRMMLTSQFDVRHSTIQVEHEDCEQAPVCKWHSHD